MGMVLHRVALLQLALALFSLYVGVLSAERSTYIIHMDKSLMPKPFTAPQHWYSSAVDSVKSTNPTTSNGQKSTAKLLYSYDNALHGFSAVLSEDELEALKESPGFLSAYGDRQAERCVIIGVVDSGVWPESKSFDDHWMTEVPSRWKGACEEGQEFNSSMCNLKLIGARYFNKGVIAANPNITISMNSARDTDGHGTHTASTAAGNYVEGASYFGYALGTARGVAPQARLAVYKVLWNEGRYASDVLAGIDQAVADGVDVISISMGFGFVPLHEDPIAIASFGAMEKGVFVSTSAGNRAFRRPLHNGIPGWTMFPASGFIKNLPLNYNKTISPCNSTELLSEAPRGILICDDYETSFTVIDERDILAVITVGSKPETFESNSFPFPGIIISPKDAPTVIKYASSSDTATASIKFQQTILGRKPAPVVSTYTSRGPSPSYPGILKPDVMAPGSLVLASWVPESYVTTLGIAALLKGAHPEWSPNAILSAMVTTANPLDNTLHPIRDLGLDLVPAKPTAMGAGHVDPNRALDPGLLYDATPQDYANLLCSMNITQNQILTITRSNSYRCSKPSSDLNYPSFIAFYPEFKKGVLVQKFERTVTNVGSGATKYKVKIKVPKGSVITVSPKTLVFKKMHEKQNYTLTLTYNSHEEWVETFGSITWVENSGNHTVRSPIFVSPMVQVP
ncbi:subtilase family protein [Actinidia rufa]|uniref:Subtilase family protein n=1 Tax=Actinidia rufa TaxID=165716 RepID=A0A7J0GER8_9ERIC|nr:subtilase family protein [Actinidia rufa]